VTVRTGSQGAAVQKALGERSATGGACRDTVGPLRIAEAMVGGEFGGVAFLYFASVVAQISFAVRNNLTPWVYLVDGDGPGRDGSGDRPDSPDGRFLAVVAGSRGNVMTAQRPGRRGQFLHYPDRLRVRSDARVESGSLTVRLRASEEAVGALLRTRLLLRSG
jgi:hypothetical protein